jgi:hypothetical protein
MEELEDTMNLPLCGLFLILLLGMCSDAFSAVTVKYSGSEEYHLPSQKMVLFITTAMKTSNHTYSGSHNSDGSSYVYGLIKIAINQHLILTVVLGAVVCSQSKVSVSR